MPLYEYECAACGKRFEIIQKFSDSPPDACRLCGKGPARRLASSPAIQFKGSGFYITDYAKKGASETGTSESTGKEGDGKAAGTKSDTKSETKTESGTKADSATKSDSSSASTTSSTPAPAKE